MKRVKKMATPRSKKSKSARDMRRSHLALKSNAVMECPNCGERYVPSMKAVVMAPHIGRSRKMTCPHCGQKGYHKKVVSKNKE